MDALRFVRGIRPPAPTALATPPPTVASVSAAPAPPSHAAAAASPAPGFHSPLLRLWPRRGSGDKAQDTSSAEPEAARGEEARRDRRSTAEAVAERPEEGRDGNWVLQILRVTSRWKDDADATAASGRAGDGVSADASEEHGRGDQCVGCGGGGGRDEESCAVGEEREFDQAAFTRLLRKVPLAEAKVYSKMSYLCNFAYMVPRIKPMYLQKYNLQFVTSSVEERTKDPNSGHNQERKRYNGENMSTCMDRRPCNDQESMCIVTTQAEGKKDNGSGQGINPFAAYQVAASAASYLQSQAMGVLPFRSGNGYRSDPTIKAIVNGEHAECLTIDEASFVATTNSVTSMVAAKEETKQAVADDLNSSRSCPCEWFICDDNESSTRYFVVQGSETIASWQANLLFEPIKFEGLDILVHRGIYEAAKGTYQKMLPYVKTHLRSHGKSARLRFTGHSLGGSLALLVNLMLLMRGVAPASSLLPVITFGAPSVLCGGDYLLQKLSLPKNHVQSITMHRDIVPRAFSCNYPDHVANILRLVNGNFRSHPCLTNQKLLYAPMGKVIILQPDKKLSPHHHLLPPGSGLYLVEDPSTDSDTSSRVLQSAMSAFFNSPHPLDILRDSSAYGPKGAVYRDHDVHSYLRSVRAVVRKGMRAEREQRRLLRWPIELHGIVADVNRRQALRLLQRHAHMVVVFLLPAKLLVMGILSVIRFN